MLVRDRIERQVELVIASADRREKPELRLPEVLKGARESARIGVLRRLAASRRFTFGDRAGGAGAARPGGPGLATSQRVIVKALVSRHGSLPGGGTALARHVSYLGRAGAGREGERGTFFDRWADGADPAVTKDWGHDRHHFRLIISPEHADRLTDLPDYVRDVMTRVAVDLGEPELSWIAICHFDTDQPHAHVLVRGRRADGRDLVMPRQYISYGVRGRAQEVAQERLGSLSRAEAEQRLWRETQANSFTRLDRMLLEELGPDGTVSDGVGRAGSWSALTRGRLRRLEQLGLAHKVGDRYALSKDLETELRSAQLRMDAVRTMNQRALANGREVRHRSSGRLAGEVVGSGFHDELGGASYAIVQEDGVEYYAALRFGSPPPRVGDQVALTLGAQQSRDLGLVDGLGC